MKRLEPVEEASYLSVPNAVQYRRIMRIFFREYEKMKFQLYKEDVLERLKEDFDCIYPEEQLKLDLEALVRWKNLTRIQDTARVNTIAEYKNKQFRYTMTENAVEIERMTVRLENLHLQAGSLSTNIFLRLEDDLERAEYLDDQKLSDVHDWWTNLQEDFRRLNQQYQDYLREFYSGRSDRLMRSVEFILHKDRFLQYLNEFVQELQHRSRRIAVILTKQQEHIEKNLLERVIEAEMDIPRTEMEDPEEMERGIRNQVSGIWDSFLNWFLDRNSQESESKRILQITNEIIRNIIQNASLIVQMQNWGVSRKEDYRKFLNMFLNCEDLAAAHRLSAFTFGVQQIAHYKENAPMETDRISQGVYEEPPMEYLLKPHTRKYREKKDRRGFADRTMEKQMLRQQYLHEAEHEQELVMQYIHDGKLIFSQIDRPVSERVRNIFLGWISQANMNSERKGRTEYGQEYVLRRKKGNCVLHCEDGDLTMPRYELIFRQDSRE